MKQPILSKEKSEVLSVKTTNAAPSQNNSSTSGNTSAELDFHVSGFIVRTEGAWTEADLAHFRHFLNLRHLSPV